MKGRRETRGQSSIDGGDKRIILDNYLKTELQTKGGIEMNKHLNVLGLLYIVLGAFHVVGLSIAIVFLSYFPWTSGAMDFWFVRNFIIIILGIVAFVSLLGIIGGIGILRGQNWAKGLVLAVGFVLLLNMPLGTLLGIYTIWVLMLQQEPAQ